MIETGCPICREEKLHPKRVAYLCGYSGRYIDGKLIMVTSCTNEQTVITESRNQMHVIKHGEPLAPLFKPGTILWRSVAHYSNAHSARLHERKVEDYFDESDRGSYVARIALNGGSGDFMREPVVIPNRQEGKQITFFGLVLFVDKLPPEDWTHLVVTGVSNVLKMPHDPTIPIRRLRGGAVFATVVKPYPMDAYLRFRTLIGSVVSKNLNTDLESLVALLLSIWPDGDPRPETCRLLSEFYFKHPDNLLDYCHLRQTALIPTAITPAC